MLRRRLAREPVSKLALWSRRIGLFAVAVMLLAIVVVRGGFFEILPALATLGAALSLAGLAIAFALAAFVVIWREGNPGFGLAVSGFAIGTALLAYPAYLGIRAYQLPPIADITTDVLDPPRFEAISRLRPRDSNPVAYAGLTAAELQQAAYPEVEPLIVSVSPTEAYEAALEAINKRKWRVVDARAPQPGRRDGRIEAVARTMILGFRDDVVVRIRPLPDGARIDFRSASRYGRSDFGVNAARVRSLSEAIDEAVGAEEPKPLAPAKAKKAPARGAQPPAKR